MHGDDGSLPEIVIDFGGEAVAATAYSLIQAHAAPETRVLGHFWCQARGRDFDIHYGENPAQLLLTGDADPFHVSYTAVHAPNGTVISDLGISFDTPDRISLNYRRGEAWSEAAILGLFSLVEKITSLTSNARLAHRINGDDPDGSLLLGTFRQWQALGRPAAA